MTQPHIVALGEPLIEFNQARGSNQYLQGFGGDTSNVAIAAARQGACAPQKYDRGKLA